LQSLSDSDSTAQEETDALIGQIQDTMTPEQIDAIKEMQLTPQDMLATLQEQDIAGGGRQAFNQNGGPSDAGGSGTGFVPPAGGGQGPGGGFGGQGQRLSQEQIATAQASRQERGGNFIQPGLLNALIEFLQKAGS
jgi:hypothetical protein